MYRPGSHSSVLCGAKLTTSQQPTIDPDFTNCVDCLRKLQADPVPDLLVDAAATVMANALVASRNRSAAIVRGDCGCTAQTLQTFASAGRCPTCSLLEFRGANDPKTDAEEVAASLLAVPRTWVIDMNRGWDGDAVTGVTYDAAYKLGRKLWRKYGHR